MDKKEKKTILRYEVRGRFSGEVYAILPNSSLFDARMLAEITAKALRWPEALDVVIVEIGTKEIVVDQPYEEVIP